MLQLKINDVLFNSRNKISDPDRSDSGNDFDSASLEIVADPPRIRIFNQPRGRSQRNLQLDIIRESDNVFSEEDKLSMKLSLKKDASRFYLEQS